MDIQPDIQALNNSEQMELKDTITSMSLMVRSKCPSYVGATGILVQEFKHIFKIITKEDRLKVIPKKNSVFAVEVNGFVSHIYGSKFQYRASERSVKKFKVKGSIDL